MSKPIEVVPPRPVRQKQPGHALIAPDGSAVQRRVEEEIARQHVGASFDQQPPNTPRRFARRPVQRRAAIGISGVDVGASIEQQVRGFEAPAVDRVV